MTTTLRYSFRDSLMSAIVSEIRASETDTRASSVVDKGDDATNEADARVVAIERAALRFDADVLFTRHMFTCVACEQTTRVSVYAYHDTCKNVAHNANASSVVSARAIVECFDYCVTCMINDCLAHASDDERALVVAIAQHEHVKTLHRH